MHIVCSRLSEYFPAVIGTNVHTMILCYGIM